MTSEFSFYPIAPTRTFSTGDRPMADLHQLQQEMAQLYQRIASLVQEKQDLEVLLDTTIEHADMVEALLHESNLQLRTELLQRKLVEKELEHSKKELEKVLEIVSRDKKDLEIILETITEHGDFIEEQTHQESIHDTLTGLYNRQYLQEYLDREFERAQAESRTLSLVTIDIDYFKRFNDTFGHDVGDRVLCQVGECLQQLVGDLGIACRYGGEEFILILPNTDRQEAQQLAEKICYEVKHPSAPGQNPHTVTVSLGVAYYPDCGLTSLELLKSADIALYQAKKNGRDRVEIASSDGLNEGSIVQ
ncbi:diguanylate cyclase [Roseofilum casamattae]|uniref:Diguanylate cyclase n=1 Tax=Roseofilum casamattae BLCC-M143 TaxID=3022442 RepID=A0ABT7BZ70_9CYAN|nr:diguanylate cyclase [Roseofilum casamattae]MDJ1184087.1 diguanylate cyclase [Roseofilum casamattae BLCC-M143]